MTDLERAEEDRRLGTDASEKPQKVQYKFMQKFYKLGPFNRDKADTEQGKVLKRDYNLPTMEDKQDRSMLPSILQKRRGEFGKKGQSKWTHLTNEDTTDFNPVNKVSEKIAQNQLKRLGGYKGMNLLERPSKRRKLN